MAGWTVVATNSRVSDPEEDRDESPWEWRANELTLEECKTECEQHDSCFGIEFESQDGSSDCIMLRRTEDLHDSPGFTIYARPGGRAHGPAPPPPFVPPTPIEEDWPLIASDSRVADPEEDRDEAPWEWRNGEMTLGECKAECVRHDTCSGIEYKGMDDGTQECIMVRTLPHHEPVHDAAGWRIYARPEVGASIFAGGGH